MKWGQIKSIFIICFLVLDTFLVTQYLNKMNSEPQALPNQEISTIEDELNRMNVDYENVPSEAESAAYISAGRYQFTEKDVKSLNNQDVVNEGDMIVSTFENPISVPEEATRDDLSMFLDQMVLYGDEYTFWSWNEEHNIMLFFQSYNDQTVYFNKAGMLMVFLNKNHEVEYYAQTRLTNIELGEEKEMSQPIETLRSLIRNNHLYSGDRISNMQLGFHTLVPLDNGIQVFVPTWEITINKEKTYFVNAIDAQSISRDEEEFIEEVKNNVETIRQRDTGSDED
ncbi:hypothetical protein GWK91_12970 [Virgibacillus sp. MSP4-1]|uniref:two-component system regulatory protein YycI n=1 Tax=Virgibacillus sp. MSP4-1 TaxID=2700081 RepID=UPI0003A2618A|nr:two-component system regulatory protein YycI [Virgibacillus sp. MSP4-1]QHS23802.1 hypothetical protein GWK91_12970 [Virgibacillus sp. MSP4-1]